MQDASSYCIIKDNNNIYLEVNNSSYYKDEFPSYHYRRLSAKKLNTNRIKK